ncbi:MAG: signal recognition particle protein [Candidatus Aenigmarchaeota archaeon]|nr:signal recognition particle protein [Candidatus Aenigmarchaeota archaeon]
MVLDKLSDSLKGTLQKVAKALFVDDTVLNELIKDIQRGLLQSDVNVKLVFELTNRIKDRAKKEEPAKGLTKREQFINIVYEELVRFLGGEKKEISDGKQRIMLVGLFGSGKTTTAGKLAKYFIKRGKRVALLGLDVHRPAAMAQIEQVAKQISAPVFIDKTLKDPVAIYGKFRKELDAFDVVIVDTAGRDALSDDLIKELDNLTHAIIPTESLLVISADIGQAAQKQAQTFHETCHITGVVVTKMDGTAKGGGALSACAVTGAPIKFIGVGENVDDFESFNPKGFVGRMLGMGDLEALLEKAKEAITEEEAQDVEKKFLSGEFTLIDLYQQMEAMSKMGSLGKLMEMIPGMGQLQLPKEALQVQEGKLEKWKHLMNSMTKKELEEPEIIDANRIERIAKGSGMDAGEIRDLLKQYRQGKKLVKMLKGADSPEKLMKKFKGKIPKMF